MAVTRSTAADRRRRQESGRAPLPGARPAFRDTETLLLAAASLVVALGLVLVYLAVSRPLAGVAAALARGEVVDLSTLRDPAPLLPLLGSLDEPAERAFVADQIVQRAQRGGMANVGELGRLRVPVAGVEKSARLPGLAARARAARAHAAEAGAAPAAEPTVPLLTFAQLRELKPHVIVRQPGSFRAQAALWIVLYLLAFAAAHAALRLRGSTGDPLLLPLLLTLTGLGLMAMISVRDPLRDLLLFRTFVEGVVGGLLLFVLASQVDVERSPVRRATFLPLLAAFALSVLLILFGSGPGGSDAKVNLFGFQPVEVIKILVVLFLAGYFFDRWEFLRELAEERAGLGSLPRWLRLPKLEYAVTPIAALAIVLLFFFLQHDLGPALVIAFLFLLLYATARGRGAMVATGAAALVLAFFVGYRLGVLPLSGVVSPFLSSGRTAMLANFLIAGVLLAVSARPGRSSQTAAAERFRGAVRWTAVGLGALGLLILGKAAWVQVAQADRYLTRGALTLQADGWRRFAYNPRLAEIAETIPRGDIVDRNGIPLATSDPRQLERFRSTYEKLGVSLAAAGGGLPAGNGRLYPFGGLTFHLLGDLRNRVNWGAPNTSYAERDSRIRLQGYDDYAAVVHVRQPTGERSDLIQVDYKELIPLLRYRWRPSHPDVERLLSRDRTLHLAIDVRLQLRAAEILARYAREGGAGGAAVVLDAANGDLLASVSYPWPQRLPVVASEDPKTGVIDRARYGIYPPGSTFKIVTALAALRLDPGLAGRTFACQRLPDGRIGNVVRGFGKPIRDDPTDTVPHGTVDLRKGIVVSCNAYFAQLGSYAVGARPLLETAKKLGITVAVPNTPQQLQKALPQAAYGQGQVTATPLQMARVAATVAAGGAMPQGRWVIDESNPRKLAPEPILTGPPLALLQQAMRQVVTAGTAAPYLRGVQPAIAGKTGTAEVQGKKSHSWFIGYAPYEAAGRRLAVAVIVEHGGYGGRLAAPAAGEIFKSAAQLGLFQAAPAAAPGTQPSGGTTP